MAEINTYTPGEKPVLALDVDGVFMMYSETRPEGCVLVPPYTAHVYCNPSVAKKLLPLTELCDPYYVTAHMNTAHEDIGKHLAFPEFDWVNIFKYRDSPGSLYQINGYRRRALETCFPDRPLTWVDDDLRPEDFDWGADRDQSGLATLLIKPDSEQGLQSRHITTIERWLGSLAA